VNHKDLIKRVGLPIAAAAIILTPIALLAQPPAGGAPGVRGGDAGQAGRGGGRGGRGGVQVDRAAMETLFNAQCDSCHKNAERAPQRDELAQRTADNVIEVLTNGAMKSMAANLSKDQVTQLAVYLTGRQPGEALPVKVADVKCATDGPITVAPGSWSKIAVDKENTAFQKNPGLKASDVPKLKLKWAWSFRASSYSQAVVVGDHMFITSGSGGGFYSLDAKTGCYHWKNEAVTSRTTPMVEHRPGLSPSGWVTFLSLAGGGNQVAAYDLADGKQLWISKAVETVGASHLTGTPALWGDTLYVPVSGAEEGRSSGECCTFRGSLVALDAKTGEKKWQTYFIKEPRTPTRKNRDGIQLQGPAGAAAWSSPTIDIKRHQVLVTTGNSTTDGPTIGTDSVIAIDLTTGKTNWNTQTYPNDNFLVNCTRPAPPPAQKAPNCPTANGPDYDYGASAIVVSMKNGKDVILSGQKSGVVHALDAKTGKVLWNNAVGVGSSLGGVEWGMATDGKTVYASNSDLVRESEKYLQDTGLMDKSVFVPAPKPGLTAIDIATGKTIWHYATPQTDCHYAAGTTRGRAPGCFHANSQAVTLIPGAIFAGSTQGQFRAHDPKTGKVIWEYDTTAQTYDTINGVKGQAGGSIDSMAATVANGVVYVMSGYAGSAGVGNNNPNVLLAFSVDGK
jgi:polyvinyl alcohol dehydrogenase (cytochrome)